jgi:hypothetical protein
MTHEFLLLEKMSNENPSAQKILLTASAAQLPIEVEIGGSTVSQSAH